MASKPPPKGATDSRVEAMVRVRPFNKRELDIVRKEHEGLTKPIIHMSGRRVALLNPEKNFEEQDAFDFDEAFWSIPREQMGLGDVDQDDVVTQKVLEQMGIDHVIGQQEVYERSGARVVQHAFDGYHSCIFAYGQTGAGKTFTMMGGLDEKGGLDETAKGRENRGLCLRLVEDLFQRIERYKEKGDKTVFKVSLSFIEIYKEKCKDLLVKGGAGSPSSRGKKTTEDQEKEYADLKVRHTPAEGTYVQGALREEIKSAKQCFQLMAYGMNCRHTAATKMNDVSSRSHAIFQITLKQHDALRGTNTISNINLVDLAGSERIKMSGAEGARFDEATKINKSLTTLRRVIDVLIENAKSKTKQKAVAPYRESMLTWLLMESLGGNSKTIMIAAVSPFSGNYEDTWNTLRYANKAKEIVCKVKRNDEQGAVMINAMRAEMDRLRTALKEKSEEQDEATRAQLEAELAEAEEQIRQAETEYEELRQEGEKLRRAADEAEEDVSRNKALMEDLKQKRETTKELQQQRQEMEEEKKLKQEEAKALEANVQEQEANIRATQAEKERLQKEERQLREKEELTKQEMISTRQRHFAIVFKNAVHLWKDAVFMEQLSGQQIAEADRLFKMKQQLQEKTSEHDEYQRQHDRLTRKHSELQECIDTLRRTHDEEIATFDSDIREHTEATKIAREEHVRMLQGIERAEREIQELHDEHETAKGNYQMEIQELDGQVQDLEGQAGRAEEEALALDEQLRAAQAEQKALAEESKKLEVQHAEAMDEHNAVQARYEDAAAQNAKLSADLDGARTRLQAVEDERGTLLKEIDNMAAELKKIDRNHRDLKDFVRNRYFPPTVGLDGDTAARTSPPRPVSPPRSHPSKGPVNHTLKSQQRAEHQASRRAVSQEQAVPGPKQAPPSRISANQARPSGPRRSSPRAATSAHNRPAGSRR